MIQKEPVAQINRQIADFGLQQTKRHLYTPSSSSLKEMGVFPFEDDKSVYSCISKGPALSNYSNTHSVHTQ